MFLGKKATLVPGTSVTFKGTMKKKYALANENYVQCSNMNDGVKGTADIFYKTHADYNEDFYKTYFYPAGTLALKGFTQVAACGKIL